ncbi:hypothetical protein U0070_017801, partial [Myodes glareolus]
SHRSTGKDEISQYTYCLLGLFWIPHFPDKINPRLLFPTRCGAGFFRTWSGECSPCDCNGHSQECLDGSGFCLHCQQNTTGEHCERCLDGYIGDSIRGAPQFCQPCPCPLPHLANFAESCYRKSGAVRCICKENYAGPNCERCAPGYYGNPLLIGSTCKKCDCSGNSDPNLIFEDCDEITGQCRNCLRNTTGFKCERCAPGYYGDARTAKNCAVCNCGGGPCDSVTGECLEEGLELPTGMDCLTISCDKCIWDLTDDLRLAALSIQESKSGLLSVSSGAAAHRHISEMNSTIHLLKERQASRKGKALQKESTDTIDQATQLVEQAHNMRDKIQEINSKMLYYGENQELGPEEIAQKLVLAQRMLEEIRSRQPFLTQRELVDEEADEAQELLSQVENWQRLHNDTRSLFPVVLEQLDDYNAKLSDIQESLHQALDHVRDAEDMNRAIISKQRDHEEQMEVVSASLSMSTDSLMVPRQTLEELDEIIRNASGIYAEIDGATNELQGKLSNLSNLSQDLVQEAMDHASNLQQEAEELSRNLHSSDMNGLVQKALDASNVYENIANYVSEANETAELALNITDRIYDAVSGIDTQIVYHKDESDNLLNQARELQAKADSSNDEAVADTSRRMGGALWRKGALRDKLNDAVKQLQAAERGDAQQRLGQSKLVIEEANRTTMAVQEVTTPMASNISNWSQNLQTFDSSAYNTAVASARDAVRNLTEVVPQLLDQLRTVEQKRPASNVSASIQRIRELIAQTRSVASKIQVSMMFDGQSAVEVHPKVSVDDLKAFASISLYMKPPAKQPEQAGSLIADQFVLYLGSKDAQKEYMGLAIKNDNLVYVYNLGDKDVEIPLDSKPVSSWPAYFSIVKIERVGKHGKVFLTVPSLSSTAEEKFIKKGGLSGNDSLLDLAPEDTVFYVGGAPAHFKLPDCLNLPSYSGCLELATLNNDVISLYNFRHIYNMDPSKSVPCARDKLAFTQSRAASYFFDGSSYAVVRDITRRGKFGQVTRFDIEVRTPADNGIVLLMVNGSMFFSLEMRNGYLHVFYDFGFSNGPVHLEDTLKKAKINDARYHEISIIYHNDKKMILVVDRRHVKSMDNEKKKIPFTDIYIGGAPQEVLQSRTLRAHLPLDINFRGCMKGFQFQKKDFNLLEQTETLGVGYGCPEDSLISRRAYFNGQSFIASTQKISFFDGFEGGFNFRTLQPNGLLFYYASGTDVFSVSLDNGTVVMEVKKIKVTSADSQYHDGLPHFVITSVSPTRYELVVDKSKWIKTLTGKNAEQTQTSEKKFYFGGSPISPQYANFTGCISNAYFTRLDRDVEVEDFQRYSEKVHTSLYECPIESSPLLLLHKKGRNSSKPKTNKQGEKNKDEPPAWDPVGLKFLEQKAPRDSHCHLSNSPRAIEHAYQYGGTANSRQEFEHVQGDFGEKSQFSIRLKTRSSHGMIFYVSDQEEDDFMTLFLAHGRLVFMFNVGHKKLKIRSQEKYNDGLWHDVIFSREKSSGRLVIDGLRVLEESLPPSGAAWKIKGPIYLGGVAPGRAVKNIQINSVYSFSGCLGNLQLNGASITSASQTFSVTPCFEGPMEAGTYFSAEGGYVVLDESFNIGLKFEIAFEVRPRSSSGTLVHGHSVNGEYLNVHMRNGQVIVKVNNGVRDFSTSVTPKQNLCDGRWHRITVIRDANVVQLDVDSEVNHVVGPLNPKPVDHREPVFVGGVPESLLTPRLAPIKPYTGCIRHFVIDGRRVSFSKAALVSGAVSINSCPTA